MTSEQEKAMELVDKFTAKNFEQKKGTIIIDYENAKQCALICVDEIIKLLPNINETPPIKRKSEEMYYQYWVGVKQEINKL